MSRHAAISRGPRLGRAPCAPGVLPPRRQPYPASRRRRAVTTRAATQRLTAFPGSTPRQPMHTTTQNRRTPPSSPPHPASADATAHPPPPLPDWQPPSQRFSCKRRIGRARPCARACGTFAASPQTAFAFVTIVENCVPIAQHPCQRTDHASPARPHCRKTPGSGRPPPSPMVQRARVCATSDIDRASTPEAATTSRRGVRRPREESPAERQRHTNRAI